MYRKTQEDDAVSPVIGVILMLVVTILIAAAITAFATGTVGDTNDPPLVMLDIKNPTGSSFTIVHKGGDDFLLKDIEVVVDSLGGVDTGILNFYTYNGEGKHKLIALGKPSNADTVISAGDAIQIEKLVYSDGSAGAFPPNTIITWKVNHVRTSSILAQGEYVVP